MRNHRKSQILSSSFIKVLFTVFALFMLITCFTAKSVYANEKTGIFNGTRVTDGEYVIPTSDTKEIDPASLKYLTANQLRIARNEIYARHGRMFGNGELQAYFENCSWYVGMIPADVFDENALTTIEETNTGTISNAESRVNPYSEYIIPDSSSVYLTENELKYLTKEQLRIARNEIYARHGRMFKDETLKKHFNSCSWYNGTISGSDFDESVFNDFENKNLALIYQIENEDKNDTDTEAEKAPSKGLKDGYYESYLNYSTYDPFLSGTLVSWKLNKNLFTADGSWSYYTLDDPALLHPKYLEIKTRDFDMSSEIKYFNIGEEKKEITPETFWTYMNGSYHHGYSFGYLMKVKDGEIVEMAITQ